MDDWWFKARFNWDVAFEVLSDNELARFTRALWKYVRTGEVEQLPGAERIAFAMALRDLEEDEQRRLDVSAKRKAAGSVGGNAKHQKQKVANATFATENQANIANDSNCQQMLPNDSNCYKSKSNSKSKNIDIDNYDTTRAYENVSTGVKAVRDNLANMSFGNWEELRELMDSGMTDDLVCLAVDEACSHGAPTWAYVRTILNEWVMNNVHSVGDAKQYSEKRKQKRNTAVGSQRKGKVVHEQQYEQREYQNTDDAMMAEMAAWKGTGY